MRTESRSSVMDCGGDPFATPPAFAAGARRWRYLSQPKSLGTNLGPHVLRAPKRPARSCTISESRLTGIPRVSRLNVPGPFPGVKWSPRQVAKTLGPATVVTASQLGLRTTALRRLSQLEAAVHLGPNRAGHAKGPAALSNRRALGDF
jgi:hypothetical protein